MNKQREGPSSFTREKRLDCLWSLKEIHPQGFGKGDLKANIRLIEVDLDYSIGFLLFFGFGVVLEKL